MSEILKFGDIASPVMIRYVPSLVSFEKSRRAVSLKFPREPVGFIAFDVKTVFPVKAVLDTDSRAQITALPFVGAPILDERTHLADAKRDLDEYGM